MKNDVSKAFSRWLEPIRIIKAGTGSYIDGEWIDGKSKAIQIKAVIQNVQSDDLILLPEGTRSTEALKIHTTSEVKTISEVGETKADTFVYDGHTYKIYDVANTKIGNYFKAIAIRIAT